MKLAGTENWNMEQVQKRILFERNVQHGSLYLREEIARSYNLVDPEKHASAFLSDSIFALARAAELAFAIDNFEQGVGLLNELVDYSYSAPYTALQFSFLATAGVLLGRVHLKLGADGPTLEKPQALAVEFAPKMTLRWGAYDSASLARLVPLLLAPAAVSAMQEPDITLRWIENLFEWKSIPPQALRSIRASGEYKIIVGVSSHFFEGRDDVLEQFTALEIDYAKRLERLRSDISYWKRLRPRGQLIDWRIVALRVAALRFSKGPQLSELNVGESAFNNGLASRFNEYGLKRRDLRDGPKDVF